MLTAIGRMIADLVGITQLRDHYREMGNPPLFWTCVLGTFAFIGLLSWLSITAEWPGSCDHDGRRVWGFIKSMRCSPDLLAGGVKEIGLFVLLWTLPAALLAAGLWRVVYELRRRANSRR